ncbi:hypothetical protein [Sinorhizobium prairiense]|uniref:hypothetical protein n=1 Tax=unclassified Sinorhizobium TaxID=2613772 RepID=UPI0023D8902E|nr:MULTISPECIES: hypothetical protein [unclassified Sinorhizobium]WEJ11163.1 hypothetical protein N0Q90_08700 [Sinorhizobium sp. M103]WEJ14237.1 hypothetical protein N0Q91_11620 [Sinorhizobium sp. K101]WEJ38147.1 hypothetical protein N0R80_08670 [Sinorhizobium sp. C101]
MENDKDPVSRFDEQMKIEVKHLKRSALLMIIPAIFAIGGRFILVSHPNTACAIAENSALLALWPQNLLLQGQLYASRYTSHEKCTFFAMQSIFAAGCYIWLLFKIVDDIYRKDTIFIPGFLKVALITITVSVVSVFTSRFEEYNTLYSLNLSQSIEINIWKNIPLIWLFVFSTGILIERALAYGRSRP